MFVLLILGAIAGSAAAQPNQEQGPRREREELRRQLEQEDIDRARRERIERERAARGAGQRLQSLEQELLRSPPLALPGHPPPSLGGPHDSAGEMMRDDALRRQQLEYDHARRALDAPTGLPSAPSGGGGLLDRPPVGADRR